jgi:AcrR family transcriptional regulator
MQTEQTRADIVAAATALFAGRGWKGTTIAGIAAEAGVAVDTIYASFGSKSALLAAAKETVKGGDEEQTPMFDRSGFRALRTGSRAERLTTAAHLIAELTARTAKLDAVWREAAAGDPAIAAELAEREAGRRSDLAHGMRLVLGKTLDDATLDGLWAITSPEMYEKLVLGRGWTREAYETWLVGTIDRLTA